MVTERQATPSAGDAPEVAAHRSRAGTDSNADQTKASGSYSHDDPDRDQWDNATGLTDEYTYRHPDGTYAFSMLRGARADGQKAFLAGYRRNDALDFLELERREAPDLFYKFPGITHFEKGKRNSPDLLYALDRITPMLEERPADPVLLTEGEKDAESALELGLIATTNPNGALNFKPEYASLFAGRDVKILVDNDDKGRMRAVAILDALEGIANSTVPVELPGLEEHGDLTDYLQMGHDKDDLLREIEKAKDLPVWVQQYRDRDEFSRLSRLEPVDYGFALRCL